MPVIERLPNLVPGKPRNYRKLGIFFLALDGNEN